MKELNIAIWLLMVLGEETSVGQGGPTDQLLTSGLCWVVMPLPKVSKNSLGQMCFCSMKEMRLKSFVQFNYYFRNI